MMAGAGLVPTDVSSNIAIAICAIAFDGLRVRKGTACGQSTQ